ncbi:disease resistance protein rga3-like [Trifolium pratense]|uniref:Disease resistance protein rga3-like n=1 Tax=Trifolium pratense TaxID=57577 RepID=A0A2K3MNF2_TRIPR|nr:disease resistance protein rga3-like [Trifolium pratense]
MAETFLFDITHSLLGKLASYAFEEVARAYGVYDDLQEIKDTLSIIRSLLLDAEEKKNQQHALREWLRQVQNICFDAEDVLDEFSWQVKLKQAEEVSGSTRMKVRRYASSSNPLAFRFKMAHQIKDIRGRLNKAAANGTGFGLVGIGVEPGIAVQRREMTHSHIDASSVIGREKDKEAIIQLLMQPHPHSEGGNSLCVIPIVGIGGLGKTTLAKLVFNDTRMDELFQLKMWVCVSDDFDLQKIVLKVINSASAASTLDSASTVAHQENISHFDIQPLQSRLRRKLFDKKFLLVLDDIWNDDRVKWTDLKDLLKVGTAGSKIMATTRSNSIASMMGTVPSYVLKGLSTDKCLSLFVKWAFKEGEEEKYPNLVEIGKEIVKKCAGVPLAVRTLGSSLFSNFDLHKWEFVRDDGLWNLKMKKGDVLPALQLSYDQMPSYLRQCFSFFSLYPKDFTFDSDEIINLLAALGFVQPQNGSDKIERIVREYMDELNSRSFLEDFRDYGYGYKFKVHDLVHDLAIYVAREDFFVKVISDTQNIPEQARHLSILKNVSLDHALFPKSKRVRSILHPVQGVGLQSEDLLNTWILRYKYMVYLDLSNSSFHTLPNSVSKLKHLCVLYIRHNHQIKRLPRSICKLRCLQVLSLIGCTELETLPEGIEKLASLRQLHITTKQLVLSLDELASLKHLQALSLYHCDNMDFMFIGAQAQLNSLEALYIRSCKSLKSLPLFAFPKLQTLLIEDCQMFNLSLNNEGPIRRSRIKHLHLKRFPQLLNLPRWIEGAVDTLETLRIRKFSNLTMLPECLTSMANLKSLYIDCCPQLMSLPSDMHRLTALEEFRIYRSPELCRKCRPPSGEYCPMIGRIKRVSVGKQ